MNNYYMVKRMIFQECVLDNSLTGKTTTKPFDDYKIVRYLFDDGKHSFNTYLSPLDLS